MKRSTKIIIAVVILVLIGVIAMGMRGRGDKKLVEVTTAKVDRQDLMSKVSATGKIEAKRKVDLSANIMGQIVNLAVREGDRIKKGDFLLQIDKAQHVASETGAEESVKALLFDRDAASASLEEAEKNFQRTQKNFNDRIIAQADLDRARSTLDASRANFAAAERRIAQARAGLQGVRDTLSKTTMRAPMDGLITRLPVEEGEVAVIGTMNNPGTVLLTISDMSVVEAVMEVDETDIPNVKVGQAAKVTIDAFSSKTFDGIVTEVGSSPVNGASTGSEAIDFEVKIQLTNPPSDIRPGFSCSADIVTGTRAKSIAVPIQALVVREDPNAKPGPGGEKKVVTEQEGVYVFDPATQKIAFKQVQTGISGDTSVEVLSGVEAGKEIVTGPFRALRDIKDGDKVRVKKDEPKKDDKEKKA